MLTTEKNKHKIKKNANNIKILVNYINQNNLLNKNGQVVCEYQNDILKEEYGNIKLLKTKKYAIRYVAIYKNTK